MNVLYEIKAIEGPKSAAGFAEDLRDKVDRNIPKAINKTRDRARKMAAEQIRREVAFPASYLAPGGQRLRGGRVASVSNPEATVVAQDNPTSLARFIVGSVRKGKPGVTLMIEPGKKAELPRAFVVNLNTNGDTKGNLGIAVRTSSGAKPSKAYRPRKLAAKAWLLYGPSVGQSFRTLLNDDPEYIASLETFLEAEFLRLMALGD